MVIPHLDVNYPGSWSLEVLLFLGRSSQRLDVSLSNAGMSLGLAPESQVRL